MKTSYIVFLQSPPKSPIWVISPHPLFARVCWYWYHGNGVRHSAPTLKISDLNSKKIGPKIFIYRSNQLVSFLSREEIQGLVRFVVGGKGRMPLFHPPLFYSGFWLLIAPWCQQDENQRQAEDENILNVAGDVNQVELFRLVGHVAWFPAVKMSRLYFTGR
jgi:hypothetical protein